MRIYIVLFALLVAMNPFRAEAKPNAGVRCVQSQLNAANFDAGPEDGLLGARTRSAIVAFEKQNGTLSSRTIKPVLGDVYCRLIGLKRPELKRFWPSSAGKVKVVYSASIDAEFRREFDKSLAKTLNAASKRLGVELAGKDTIVIADNAKDMLELVRKYGEFSDPEQRRNVRESCKSTVKFFGRTQPGLTYFCKAPNARLGDGIEQTWFDFAIAHEYIHLVQFQLSGAVDVSKGLKHKLKYEGPIWLIEGVAQAFANTIAMGTPDWDFRIVMYQRMKNKFPNLASLEKEDALNTRISEVYRAGTVGAIDLIDLNGYPAIFKMFDNMGRGEPWMVAFENAFGMSVKAYYKFYASVNRFEADGSAIRGPLSK